MAELFNRRIRLVVADLDVSDLDVSFRVEKSLKMEPNDAEIVVFNLSKDSRGRLHDIASGIPVELHAGYVGDVSRIFLGQLRDASSKKEGPDWVTTIESGDGEKARKDARTNISFSPGVGIANVVERVAKDLKVGLGNLVQKIAKKDFKGAFDTFVNGTAVSGATSTELEKLLGVSGLEASIQDGALQVLTAGDTLPGDAVLLRPDTGLIGTPEPGADGLIKARSLMNSNIFPGRRVRIESSVATGFYRVERAVYTGEIRGPPWYVEIEARAL